MPPGVHVDMPLQAYFRINAENAGQFERTLIIADEGSSVHYVEGCSAPVYTTDSLHSAVVELIAKPGARIRYTTIQNWSPNVYNLVTKRARAETEATVEWIDGNLGSKLTMKYPAVVMTGPKAHGEVLSVAYAGAGQHQDAGAKMTHAAPETTSIIDSKSISKDGGRTTYRGLVKVEEGAHSVKSHVRCDALILDEESRSDTYPYMEIDEKDAAHRPRGHGLEGRRRPALLPDEPRAHRAAGDGDDRERLHRADHQDAADGVRGRAVPPHRAQHGGRGRLTASTPRRSLLTPRARSAVPTGWRERRVAAAEQLADLVWPTAPEEIWRYSRIDEFDLDALPPARRGRARPTRGRAGAGRRPVRRRGRRARRPRRRPQRPGRAPRARPRARGEGRRGLRSRHLRSRRGRATGSGRCTDASPDAFTVLHDAFLAGGAFIRVPAGVVVDRPIVVLHWSQGDGRASFPHTLVVAGERPEVTLVDRLAGLGGRRRRHLVDAVVELLVGDGAHVRYLSVQEHGPRDVAASRCQRAHLGRDATLRSSAVALGGDYARLRSESLLAASGAESDLLAVYFGDDEQMLDFRTLQDHDAPHTRSDLLFKGAVEDSAHSVYSGSCGFDPRRRRPRRTRRTATSCSPKVRRGVDPEPRDRGQRRAVLAREHRRTRSTTTSATTSRAAASRPRRPSA